jgi:hypothetical protein
MTGNDIIRSAFTPIAGLPCWQALGEFGTWLTFHFGTPKFHVTEPSEAIHHLRFAGVEGKYVLRLEAYQWVAFQNGGWLAHSESPRDVIRQAAVSLQGQKLIALTVRTNPAGGEFVFDLGGRVAYQVRDPDEEELWSFHTRIDSDPAGADIVSFTAAGGVSLFRERGSVHKPGEYAQETEDYVIQGVALTFRPGVPSKAPGRAG